jgi:hypothetical protein
MPMPDTAKITRKVKRAGDFALYAERNLVERFFNAIKLRYLNTLRKDRAQLPCPDWCTRLAQLHF